MVGELEKELSGIIYSVIFLNEKIRLYFKVLIIGLICSAIFIGSGYYYLDKKINTVENKTESVPYYQALPSNAGVLFVFGEKSILCYLDFEQKIMNVVSAENYNIENGKIAGYPIDFTVEADYNLIGGIVDILGGINLETEDGVFSFTGVQVKEMLETMPLYQESNEKIAEKIFYEISRIGFKREDFLYIIENSKTNLSVPDCYYWAEYMKELCYNVRFIR